MPDNIEERINYSSGLPTEPLRGFSRAVRSGPHLYISATAPISEKGEVVGIGDPYIQTKYIIQILRQILREAGFEMSDVVRTRMYVTQLSSWNDYARAHREAFEKIRPASSIIEVSRLMDARSLVEIEAEAIKMSRLQQTQSIALSENKDDTAEK